MPKKKPAVPTDDARQKLVRRAERHLVGPSKAREYVEWIDRHKDINPNPSEWELIRALGNADNKLNGSGLIGSSQEEFEGLKRLMDVAFHCVDYDDPQWIENGVNTDRIVDRVLAGQHLTYNVSNVDFIKGMAAEGIPLVPGAHTYELDFYDDHHCTFKFTYPPPGWNPRAQFELVNSLSNRKLKAAFKAVPNEAVVLAQMYSKSAKESSDFARGLIVIFRKMYGLRFPVTPEGVVEAITNANVDDLDPAGRPIVKKLQKENAAKNFQFFLDGLNSLLAPEHLQNFVMRYVIPPDPGPTTAYWQDLYRRDKKELVLWLIKQHGLPRDGDLADFLDACRGAQIRLEREAYKEADKLRVAKAGSTSEIPALNPGTPRTDVPQPMFSREQSDYIERYLFMDAMNLWIRLESVWKGELTPDWDAEALVRLAVQKNIRLKPEALGWARAMGLLGKGLPATSSPAVAPADTGQADTMGTTDRTPPSEPATPEEQLELEYSPDAVFANLMRRCRAHDTSSVKLSRKQDEIIRHHLLRGADYDKRRYMYDFLGWTRLMVCEKRLSVTFDDEEFVLLACRDPYTRHHLAPETVSWLRERGILSSGLPPVKSATASPPATELNAVRQATNEGLHGDSQPTLTALVQPQAAPISVVDEETNDSRIRITGLLGKGAYAETYKGIDTALDICVAVKYFNPSVAISQNFVLNQARALARAPHPNIVTVFAVTTLPHPESGRPVEALVMELVDGPTLESLLSGARLFNHEVERIGTGILAALEHIHSKGLAHMDLHVGNVIIDVDKAKIIDILYDSTLSNMSDKSRQRTLKTDIAAASSILYQMMVHSTVDFSRAGDFNNCRTTFSTVADLKAAFLSAVTPTTDLSHPTSNVKSATTGSSSGAVPRFVRHLADYILHRSPFRRTDNRERSKEEIVGRFDRILESQDLKRLQCIRVVPAMKHLTTADVLDDERLLQHFNNETLDSLAATFGVQRAWLDLADNSVYAPFSVYKNLLKFLDLLIELKSKDARAELHAVKGVDNRLEVGGRSEPIAVFLREEIDRPDEAEPVWRDLPINDTWIWTHRPCRIELKALALMAWQFRISIDSHVTNQACIDDFLAGKLLCGELIKDTNIFAWHLDDYIFTSTESKCSLDEREVPDLRQYLEGLKLLSPLLEAADRTRLRVPLE